MSFYTAERIYELLPAYYRIRDIALAAASRTAEQEHELAALRALLESAIRADASGPDATRLRRQLDRRSAGPLRALVEIIAEQIAVIEEDLEQLEDNQFIETCAEWVVPYIGELVGASGVSDIPGGKLSRRGQVANTLAYRRRKGTAAVLEQLARDVTGWDSSVVEFFQRLVWTQHMNHIRPEPAATTSVRGIANREPVDGPFGDAARSVDVRRIADGRGKLNIPNVGLYLWRVQAFSWTDVPAFRHNARRYAFHPLGLDTPLFNARVTEQTITHLASPDNVPHALRRRDVRRRLGFFYGRNNSFAVSVGGGELPLDQISICDLSDWGNTGTQGLSIDPELGRMVFSQGLPANADVRTVFRYGFALAIGGGEYSRATTLAADLGPVETVHGGRAAVLQTALDGVASGGAVEIRDSSIYNGAISIRATAGAAIELRSADHTRAVLRLSADLEVSGGPDASITLNGLALDGGSIVVPEVDSDGNLNRLRRLRLEHCTIRPGAPPISVIATLPEFTLEVESSIVGALRIADTAEVLLQNSIVDAGDTASVAYSAPDGDGPGAPGTIRNVTIIGKVHTRILQLASNTIFLSSLAPADSWNAPVRAARLQEGCVRFSYVPLGAQVPRRHRCQPADALQAARVRPVFGSLEYGDPSYALLDPLTPEEILTGADDQSEMGAFHDLFQPQREAALRARLREHLRFGLEAGVLYAT